MEYHSASHSSCFGIPRLTCESTRGFTGLRQCLAARLMEERNHGASMKNGTCLKFTSIILSSGLVWAILTCAERSQGNTPFFHQDAAVRVASNNQVPLCGKPND